MSEPISDEELSEVRARKCGYWPGSIIDGLVARIDQAEAALEAISQEVEVMNVICEQVAINGIPWAEFRKRLHKIMPKSGI